MTEPVRVGVNLAFLDPGRLSGTATYSWSLIRELAGLDDLQLVLLVQDGHVPEPALSRTCDVVSCPRFGNVAARVAWEQLRLPRLARRHELDVLWSTGYVSPLLGAVAKVVTVHDLYYARCPEAIPRVRRWYYRAFIPRSVRACRRVIAVSRTTRDDLAELVPASIGKTAVVHEAARDDIVRLTPRDPGVERPYFLVVASVTHNKNVDTVVRAAVALRESGVDAPVHVVGEDPYGILAATISAHDAHDVVRPIGWVDDAELAGWYRGATAVIHASRYEGFGLPALEAQAMGTPLVCSRGGALPEIVGDGAVYFDHDRPDELVDALQRLLTQPDLAATTIERGHRNRSRFSWTVAAQQTATVLREAARR